MDSGITRLITPEGPVDLTDETDRVMFLMRQELGRAAFSRSLSKNVTRSALRRALEGLWVSGNPPYGYVIGPDGKLALGDPAEVEAVRWMFRQYAETADSLGDLVRRLNEMGFPPPHGGLSAGHWRRNALCKMLKNPAYVGDIAWNRVHRGKYSRVERGEVRQSSERRKRRALKNDQADVILSENAHPALVDRDTFATVARKLVAMRWKRTTPIPGGGEWVLSGLMRCGDCGEPMYGRKEEHRRGKQRYVYRRYFCSSNARHGKGSCRNNSVLQEWIVEALAALVCDSFADGANVELLTAQLEATAREEVRQTNAKVRALEEQLAELDAKIEHGKGNLLLIPADLVAGASAQLRKWQEERSKLAAERDSTAQAVAEDAATAARVSKALKRLQTLQKRITTAPPDQVRDVFRHLVKSVTVRFDHSRPRNQTHAVEIEVVTTPAATNLLPPAPRHRS
jgi:hypothetical protein